MPLTKVNLSTNLVLGSNTSIAQSMPLRRLYFYHELDEWQKDNHFIKSGYIKESKSFRECFHSLYYLHNESVNIYSHLVPSLAFFPYVFAFVCLWMTNFENDQGIWERLNFLQFGLAASFCMFSSASFHCFKCHSKEVSKFGNQCDYFGIVVLITCSLISIVLFAFYDVPFWRNLYVMLFLILGTICTKVTFDQKFATPQYRPFRSLVFILFGLSGVLPVVTAVFLFGISNAYERSNALWLVLEGVFYITGALLYAARFPERLAHNKNEDACIKGQFDIFGHSHQIFHFLVVVAACCHWKALNGCYLYLHTHIL